MLKKEIQELSKQIHGDIIDLRRHLHTYPELSFQEHQTCAFIKTCLDKIGIPSKPIANTGLVAIIEGSMPGDVVALRADIDALPIQEQNNVAYASQHPGVMHACGHDFHTSSLLGTARILHAL